MKDVEIEGDFFVFLLLFVRIYKQLDAMVQNGILLTFTRLANVFLMFFLDVSEFPVPFSFPFFFSQKAAPIGVLSRTFLNQSPRTERTAWVCLPPRHAAVSDMGLLFMGLNLHPPQYIMYIMLWGICLLRSSTALSGFLIPTTSSLLFLLSTFTRLSICIFYACVESPLEFAGQGGALKEMDFSLSTEWNLATGICRSRFNLSSKLEG